MPTRVLRDWTDSDRVNKLSAEGERLFIRLIMKADDYGRYFADTKRLKSFLFPLTESLRESDISRWLDECQQAGVIRIYEVAGKRYLELLNFNQRMRQMKAVFPIDSKPPTTDSNSPPDTDSDLDTDNDLEKVALVELPQKLRTQRVVQKWAVWMNVRRGMKKPKNWTTLFNGQIEWLSQFSEPDVFEILSASIRNGWQGLFEPKKLSGSNQKQSNPHIF